MSSSSTSVVRLEPQYAQWPRPLFATSALSLLALAWFASTLGLGWLLLLVPIAWWLLRPSPATVAWLLVGRRVEQPGDPAGADLVGYSMLGPLLSLQLIQDSGGRRSLLFGPWNLSPEQRRQLRLHLRRLES
ncbi:MAG: hypothetical protein KDI56_04620 [Xanthomonadales bacterium]|nr:hypothetical protein [Xanthomonadales bacterium]MCB1626941.1 hypothetical protein [Xanthomonadales bacterium]MCB1636136.1 hypothetical protein [Xanthomonadales bacterium]